MAQEAERFDEEGKPSEEELQRQKINAIVGRLEKEAEDRVGKRDLVESRWLEDLQQFHGRYRTELIEKFKEAKKSYLYINSTRPKTNAMASRLSDMLFPTDDRNWGIQPTPVPELTVEAEEAAKQAAQAAIAVVEDPENPEKMAAAEQAMSQSQMFQARMDEAKKRARSMEEEIDDHLREGQYAAQARDVIEDGCKLGTGIFKGPVIGDRSRRKWQQQEQDIVDAEGNVTGVEQIWGMQDVEDPRPVYWRVNPWDWFPDMDARRIEDSEGNFERHLMNNKQLKRLARQPGFDKDAIRRLLVRGPTDSMPTYIADMRSITGAYHDDMSDRFHVWEYHGPLSMDDMMDLAAIVGGERGEGIMQDLEDTEIDPLSEINAIVWFCDGELLKFGLHYLDSGDPIYSVFNLEKDDASVFGFGVPYIMRDPQKAMASAWRALMDNAGLSSGPQVVINEDCIEPVDGVWALSPRKIWRKKKTAPKGEKAFESFNIPSNIEELTALIEFCRKNVDEETSTPMIAQGEQGANVTKTAQGMSLLMNSANIVFRRIVKNWDDDITAPTIRRMYDFLMQFSEKEHIKGDYEIDARGTSVLLVREMQSANLMLFLTNFSGHPVLGKYLQEEGLPGLRALARTMMLPADELVKTDDQVEQDRVKASKEPPPPNPEMEKIAAERNMHSEEWEARKYIAQMDHETQMMKLAETKNMTLDQIMARLTDSREERESKERLFAAEAAVTKQEGASGGGYL